MKYSICTISLLLVLFASCTTRPVMPPDEAGPLSRLAAGEDFYLLARPAEHPALATAVLGNMMDADPVQMQRALERTDLGLIAGRFSSPLEFSGILEGDYPAFFVRRSLRKSPDWEKQEEKVWKGPDEILTDTLFKDTLIAASEEERLAGLQQSLTFPSPRDEAPAILPDADRQWWEGGAPAILLHLPSLGALPLPQGLPSVPEDSSLTAGLTEASAGTGESYTLSADLRFSDERSARMWALALRIYLAARLGRSDREEERAAMRGLQVKADGPVIRLDGWTMSPAAWAVFLAEFGKNGGI